MAAKMDLWGGMECTVNRINGNYFDQLDFSGHYARETDTEAFMSLGIKAIRYPILWETHQPLPGPCTGFECTEKKLEGFKNAGIQVIAGLVHHGSGPSFASILDKGFACGLAAYAREVALRFPWIAHYTPVNEPLTTARFCGLYGIWYPHKNDDASFVRILVNECYATILAMKAIREINPDAKLVQTEDIGKIHATAALQYQSDFENKRRWLSFDLLNGRLDSSHELYAYLLSNGISEVELDDIRRECIVPDILGINYYVTSERYLDGDYLHYPQSSHGGNGIDRYADIEAIRTGDVEIDGPEEIIAQVWNRFHLPIAITEAHLHCGREDQLRWLKYIWDAAEKNRYKGIDVIAVTVWSLLGSYGWNSLLTETFDHYEAGPFDVSSGVPRATAIAVMARQLSGGNPACHPVLDAAGWWQMPYRVMYGRQLPTAQSGTGSAKPLLVLGSESPLGKAFIDKCSRRNICVRGISSNQIYIHGIAGMTQLFHLHEPWAVVNAFGYKHIDFAEGDAVRCYSDNAGMVKELAEICYDMGRQLLTFSDDMVFDGTKDRAYHEGDLTNPVNLFGRVKLQAEQFALQSGAETLVVRTGALFEKLDNFRMLEGVMPLMRGNGSVFVPTDIFLSVSFLPEVVDSCIDLLIDGETGIWHLSNPGSFSWYDFASMFSTTVVEKGMRIRPISIREIPHTAARPRSSVLESRRGNMMSGIGGVMSRLKG